VCLATRKLLLWFEKRRRSKTLNLAQQQIVLAMSTVGQLDTALKAFSDGRREEMESAIGRLFAEEEEIDALRRTVMEELAGGELPVSYREDLKRLIRLLDEFADQVKDSARSLKVLGWQLFPREIMDQYLKISQDLVDGVKVLGNCIEVLGTNPFQVKEQAERVDFYEGRIDEEYLNTKMLFIKYGRELDPATLIILRDLVDFMERASDTCARTADYLRTLASSEIPG
jgi:predicted phosphate transport protein (TIGR00153 family)